MSDRMLHYFERELESIKQEAVQFAASNPGLAANLGINEKGVDDPNVSRLIESVAFLNAKISKKLDDGVNELAESILGTLYPDVEAPFPATSAVKFKLDGSLTTETRIQKGELITVTNEKGEEWTFSIAADTEIGPIEISGTNYWRLPFDKPEVSGAERIKSKLSIDFSVQKEVAEEEVISINEITLKLSDEQRINSLLYTLITKDSLCIEVSNAHETKLFNGNIIKKAGFDTGLRLLPKSYQQLDAMQLAREVLNSKESFQYLTLDELDISLKASDKLTINIYLLTEHAELEQSINQQTFQYGCIPLVNLYNKAAEPYKLLGNKSREIEVAGTKGKTLEVYKIDEIDCIQGKSERKTIAAAYQPGMMTDSPLRWSANRIYKATDKGSCNKTILTIINQDEVDDHIICPRVWVKDHSDISRNINRSQQINIEFARARSEFTDLELAEPVREGKKLNLMGNRAGPY